MSYVLNAWYVAGWSRDFQQTLTPLEITGQCIVVFRTSGGELCALEDSCPHRRMPLSKGKLLGDNIQCGYHGMTFNGGGACVRIPGQDNTPASASVRAYPVEERHGIVWMWMGDPTQATPDTIFTLPEFSDDGWYAHLGGHLSIKSHYLNVAENLVDPAHVSFVHPTTLGNAASENVPVHVSTEGEVISAWRWIRDAEPIGFFKSFGGFSGNVDRWHYYDLHLPSTAVIDFGSIDVASQCKEEDRNQGVRIFAIHFVTPVNEHQTIDHWMHLRNTGPFDDTVSAQMDAMFQIAFDEDKHILEAIHEAEQRPQTRRSVRIAIDKGPLVYRKRIRDLIANESMQDLGAGTHTEVIHHDSL